jgi:CRISPR-associated protein Csd1
MAARGEAEPPGFSREKISFAVVIDCDGGVVDVDDLRDMTGKRPVPRLIDVPAAAKRTVAVAPYLFWDKSAYALGVTGGEGKRVAREHQAFRDLHFELLADSQDEGLVAFRRFLEAWAPARFGLPPFMPAMLDTNIVFRLQEDRGDAGKPRFIHQRPAALPLIEARSGDGARGFCLVTGAEAPIARLHPAIKGVEGGQTMGGALVSFNLDAFESWGREQGDNATTGEAAAFRYGAALNRLLDRGSSQRMQVGDATVVFWADTGGSSDAIAAAAEKTLASVFGTTEHKSDYDPQEAGKLRDALEPLSKGRAVETSLGELHPKTLIHVLGLSPNAARLAVRFWLTENLGTLARNLARHFEDTRIDPSPYQWGIGPSINRLLVKTTSFREKWDNIPPLLAGEVTRAVLGGGRYPHSLLAAAIIRLRAGDDPATGWHAAVIRGVLQRSNGKGAPMGLSKEETNPAYRLGRLFAVLEAAQYNALGRVNASIRDRYFGAASATPASVFPLLLRGGQNHLAVLRKEGKAGALERDLEEIVSALGTALPRSLKLEDQGRFAIGYYHQRAARFAKKEAASEDKEGDQNT